MTNKVKIIKKPNPASHFVIIQQTDETRERPYETSTPLAAVNHCGENRQNQNLTRKLKYRFTIYSI